MPDSKTYCLRDLFRRDWKGVLIPIVQRDYAQGRPGVGEVRGRFLDALHTALKRAEGGAEALDLDFIYGYELRADDKRQGQFVPIDGQQRLTTLFLLHWYLALLDGAYSDFQSWAAPKQRARFEYAVRSSSDEFLTGLAATDLDLDDLLAPDPGGDNALSKTLRNEHWYYRSWERDPTVRACLTMLDDIHAVFRESVGFYARLVGPKPAITFQFLDLDEFGLGDELYIKMNARGRPLTRFEVIKSELEKYARSLSGLPDVPRGDKKLPMHKHLGIQFDTTWTHLLWRLLREEHATDSSERWTRQLDHQMLNLVRTLAITTHPEVDTSGKLAQKVEKRLEDLHNGHVTTFPAYAQRGAIHDGLITSLVTLMDLWSNDDTSSPLRTFLQRDDYYDEVVMFRAVRSDQPRRGNERGKPKGTSTNYSDVVLFSAYCTYLLSGRDRGAGLDAWMRVLANLTHNTPIERGEHLRRALASIRQLLSDGGDDLLTYLAGGGAVAFFLAQQVREEQLKAQLIRRHADWRPLIERAELHPYFKGQIEFLFAFCGVLSAWLPGQACGWTDDQDRAYRAAFETWLNKATAVFVKKTDDVGLVELPEYLWERALLCHGDYLLRRGKKWSLLVDSERDVSWKRLLRGDMKNKRRAQQRDMVRRVLEDVDPDDLVSALRAILAAGVRASDDDSKSWRRRLVSNPSYLKYCQNRWLRWEWDGNAREEVILLLRKVRRGNHRELYTWDLGLKLQKQVLQGKLAPIQRADPQELWGVAVRPGVDLYAGQKTTVTHRIRYVSGRFVMFSVDAAGVEIEVFRSKRGNIMRKLGNWSNKIVNGADSS